MSEIGLRERNAAATRERVMRAGVALLEEEPYVRLTMPAIAEAADVSLRTLYRYYADRDALSLALGRFVDERLLRTGLPRTGAGVAEQMESIGPRFEEHVALIRALVGTRPGAERSPRRGERLAAIEEALASKSAALPPAEARRLVGVVQLLASAPAWLQLRDEGGLSGEEAGDALGWAIRRLLGDTTRTTDEGGDDEH